MIAAVGPGEVDVAAGRVAGVGGGGVVPRPGHHPAPAATRDPPGGDIHLARSHSRDHLTSPASRRGLLRLVPRRQAADFDQLQAERLGPGQHAG